MAMSDKISDSIGTSTTLPDPNSPLHFDFSN